MEARLCDDTRIGMVVNNAGPAAFGGFVVPNFEAQDRLIRLNITMVTRLAGAIVPRFLAESGGAIVNIASAPALAP